VPEKSTAENSQKISNSRPNEPSVEPKLSKCPRNSSEYKQITVIRRELINTAFLEG